MKQIDQDPRHFRPQTMPGEPIFVPGAGMRVLVAVVIIGAMWIVTAPIYFAVMWLMSPLEPIVKGFIRSWFS